MPGSSGQFGGKAESTFATRVTVDRFWEIESEDIKPLWNHIEVPSIRAGGAGFDRTDRHLTVITGYRGPVKIPMLNKNNGLLFEQAMGQNTVSTITGSARRHTCIPDAAGQLGKSMTLQVGRPNTIDNTVHPFTYGGCKLYGFELACNVSDPLMATFDVDAANLVTDTALATASFVSGQEPWVWTQAAVSIAGSSGKFVKGFTLKYARGLALDRLGLGNLKREQVVNGLGLVEGELDCEFESLAEFANAVAGTFQEIIITFTSATMITGSTPYVFKITVPKAVWKDPAPVIAGPGLIPLKLGFKGYYDGTNAPLTVVLDSADTAA